MSRRRGGWQLRGRLDNPSPRSQQLGLFRRRSVLTTGSAAVTLSLADGHKPCSIPARTGTRGGQSPYGARSRGIAWIPSSPPARCGSTHAGIRHCTANTKLAWSKFLKKSAPSARFEPRPARGCCDRHLAWWNPDRCCRSRRRLECPCRGTKSNGPRARRSLLGCAAPIRARARRCRWPPAYSAAARSVLTGLATLATQQVGGAWAFELALVISST